MKISRITVDNFLRLKHADILLENRGPVLVVGENLDDGGSNGAGKSTLFDAVVWGLFGRTVRGVKGGNVALTSAPVKVVLYLKVKDRLYVLERSVEKGKHVVSVSAHDGPIVDARVRDAQEAIDRLLGVNYDIFTRSVFAGQGLLANFASLTSAQQKEVFESLLDLSIFADAKERTQNEKKNITLKLAAVQQNTNTAKAGLESTNAHIADLTEKKKLFEEEKYTKISLLKKQVEGLSRRVDNTLLEIQRKETDNFLAFERLSGMAGFAALYIVSDIITEAHKKSVDLQIRTEEDALRVTQTQLSAVTKEARRLSELVQNGKCPECGADTTSSPVYSRFMEINEMVKQARAEAEAGTKRVAELRKKLPLQRQLSEPSWTQFTKNASTVEMQMQLCEKDRQAAQGSFQSQLGLLTAQQDELNAQENPYQRLLDADHATAAQWEVKLAAYEKEEQTLQVSAQYVDFWIEGFGQSGIRSYYLKTVTPFLNSRAQFYLSRLLPEATIRFETVKQITTGELRDNFHVEVALKNGAEEFSAASGGEKQCVNIAVALAMQDLCSAVGGAGIGITLLDEVCTDLDVVRSARVAQMLAELVEKGTILVISNNEELKPFFQRRIIVQKEHGIAVAQEE